jgi:glycosyl hydrolase family 106( putative alpha-L-rhamnosidase)
MAGRLATLAAFCFLITALVFSAPRPDARADLYHGFTDPPADTRIMMRWWWFGPAVTNTELERELRAMKDAGIGGVEIQAVYPLTLDDAAAGIRNIPFLSDEFLERLRFAAGKARELGLRVDLTLGSGWPYGGPGVTIDHASARLRHERVSGGADSRQARPPYIGPGERLISAVSRPGATEYFIASRTGQQVKRAAVGAEGFVLDHYDRSALDAYLAHTGQRLLSAFSTPPYAIFCDSLEVYEADWTGDFLQQFQTRRGYDLKPQLPALVDDRSPDALAIRHDWGLTLKELLDERFVAPLAQWARAHGTRLRLQGYGTPPATPSTNALADLPEGEGADWKALWAGRWASSANHIYDRPVTSSETWTWLHSPVFRATPLDIKTEADRHFLQGINQLIGHGWPYSPPGIESPGWRFYAAAALNDHNPWWIVMPDVTRYLQRVSFLLRQGAPVSDVAIYLPVADGFAHFTPGHVNLLDTLRQRVGTDLIPAVLGAGYTFDFFDDEALKAVGRVEGNTLRLGPQRYSIVIVPAVERMPFESLRMMDAFARAGGIVIATKRTPELAPGFIAKAADHQAIRDLAQRLFRDVNAPGHFVADERTELAETLTRLHQPEMSVSAGAGDIGFVHRRIDAADVYFIANTGNGPIHASAALQSAGTAAEWWDPMTGARAAAALTRTTTSSRSVTLDLPPYGSTILVISESPTKAPAATGGTESESVDISGQWTVAFGNRGTSATMDRLRSWSDDESTRYFSGVATYERSVDVPASLLTAGSRVRLDFGVPKPIAPQPNGRMQAWLDAPVRDAAVVFVNGRRAGSVWCPPYSIDITSELHPGGNALRLEVANTAINEIAGHALPNYRLLNLRYGSRFDAQDMDKVQPQPSGLLGPIRLVRVAAGDIR